jgi:glycosyltransferase involved in cell wall biosynthesis
MKVWQIYNHYRSLVGGEELVVRNTIELLEKRSVYTKLLSRSSKTLEGHLAAKIRAFWSGIYSRSAYHEIRNLLRIERPDIVHAHNLYPLFSPSVLVACHKAGVPIVMTPHNYSLTCPNWAHLYEGQICERCVGGREYYCVLKNCRKNLFESIGYALRTAVARKLRFFHDNVTVFIALTHFAKGRLIDAGFAADRIFVLPNMVHTPDRPANPSEGKYIAYVGRIDPEKGIDTLLAAAHITGLPIYLAGAGGLKTQFEKTAPAGIKFLGPLDRGRLDSLYRNARFVVVPSKWFEMCPLVISEASSYGLPVIASRIGGLPELVVNGTTGLLIEPGNVDDLAHKMKRLWDDPTLCDQMGQAGREKMLKEHNEEVYFQELLSIYKKAIDLNGKAISFRHQCQ